jgi:predicted transposase/invertase (TIGR01784 family)
LESESNPKSEDDKFIRVDLLVKDSQNRKIYIEIQNAREKDYMERLLFASSKIIVENQKLGKDFSDISKVISISILYFNIGFGDDYLYYGTTEFAGMNSGNPLVFKKKEESTDLFKPKYTLKEKNIFPEYYLITVERYQNIIKKRIDEWIYIFKNSEVAKGSKSKNIAQAEQKLALINMSDEERANYENFLINFAREQDVLKTAQEEGEKIGIAKGEKIGIEKGEKIGIEKGEKIGIKIGIEKEREKNLAEKKEIIKEMILDGMSDEKIAKLLKIEVVEVAKTRSELA